VIVDHIAETVFLPEVSFCLLDRNGTEWEMNLLQLASCLVARPCTSPSQVVRSDCWQAAAFRVSSHICPDHRGHEARMPDVRRSHTWRRRRI